MRHLTQTNLSPGNCWQTAVACILDVPAETLPDQAAIEATAKPYVNALQAYLHTHHGKMYACLHHEYLWAGVRPPLEPYLWEGPTVRTAENGGIEHVVVALESAMLWDPHPSRAGLTRVKRWATIVNVPDEIAAHWVKRRESDADFRCHCPACVARGEA